LRFAGGRIDRLQRLTRTVAEAGHTQLLEDGLCAFS